MPFRLFPLLVFAHAVIALPTEKRATDPTVTIASGVVVGTTTGVSNQASSTSIANAYLGIPYASPPVRFSPPTAPGPWTDPLIAQSLPPACLQQFFAGDSGARERHYFNDVPGAPPGESEDCLYLNIYAPSTASPTNLKAVMFWIYGGNLQFGASSVGMYDGTSLAIDHDVIVVTINYRTNIFGFSNSPEIPLVQRNSGFLDQRFALQWVLDNIRAFGGDPDLVTLFGESAGGYSVKQLLAYPPSPLPFSAAIMQSPAAFTLPGTELSYDNVLAHFGCDSAVSPLGCLREVPGTSIQSYITDQNLFFSPSYDSATYAGSETLAQIKNGSLAQVPILIGTNLNEGTVFADIFGLDESDIVASVQTATGFNVAGIYDALMLAYPQTLLEDPSELLPEIITDIITCSTSSFSSAVASAGNQPVWRYRYDGVFPNMALFPSAGAFHTVEIPEVFGTYPRHDADGNAVAAQIALSQHMQGVWSNIAKNPTAGPGWPSLGSDHGLELGVLGGVNATAGESTQPLSLADSRCAVMTPFLTACGYSY